MPGPCSPPPSPTCRITVRCQRGSAKRGPGSFSSTTARTPTRLTPGTRTCWAPLRDRGPLTGASQCRAGRQRGQPRSFITWCTRCRPRDSARLPSLPYSVVRHLFTSLSAAGPTRMIACLLIAGNEMPRSTGSSRSRGRAWSWPAWLVVVAAAVAACSSGGPPAQSPSATAQSPSATLQSPSAPAQICQQLAVPAYFYPSATWAQAADSKPAPSNMILDISGVGAGDGPVAHFQAVVRQARARNITVLGYISTVDGQRRAAQVEAEVRNYRAWYGVTSIFLEPGFRTSAAGGLLSAAGRLHSSL